MEFNFRTLWISGVHSSNIYGYKKKILVFFWMFLSNVRNVKLFLLIELEFQSNFIKLSHVSLHLGMQQSTERTLRLGAPCMLCPLKLWSSRIQSKYCFQKERTSSVLHLLGFYIDESAIHLLDIHSFYYYFFPLAL